MANADTTPLDADWAQRMLDSEQHSLVRLLHDDLGQNLVAIKSFAAAIAEQHADDDTGELAGMIREAADLAYRSSYDLMQELRAQYLADREIGAALEACLEESRLRENGIDYICNVDPLLADLGELSRAFVLRSVRCYANLCKSLDDCERISLDISAADDDQSPLLALILEHDAQQALDPAHFSLLALADRLEAIGGTLEIDVVGKRLELRFERLERGHGTQS